MLKNRYKDDYTAVTYLDGNGRVVKGARYTGDFYVLPFTKDQKKKTGFVNLFFSLLLLGVFLAGGMVNQDSSHTVWIVFPYLFVFLPIGYLFVGTVSYFGVPVRMEKAAYEGSLARIRHSCLGVMVMASISGLLDILYLVLYHENIQIGRECLYLFCHILFLLTVAVYGRLYDRMYGKLTVEKAN